MQNITHDIIIVGGGIVGLTLACALAQQTSLSIAIFEAHPEIDAWHPTHYHHRVSAISLASQRIFRALTVWQEIKEKRISPFTNMHVWDASTNAQIHFASNEIAEQHLGFIIENNVIQSALMDKIKKYPQIDFIAPIKMADCQQTDSHVELTLADTRIFRARLAIAADGAQSWLREKAGVQLTKEDYGQKAIVATVHTELAHAQTARQVFLASGPLAFLPLENAHASSIVWTLPAETAKKIKALSEAEFKHALAHAFSSLGNIVSTTERFSFPLHKQQANHYVSERVVLVGDAAHTVHPLAGQGVNIGLLDAACLAEVIADALQNRRNFASLATLRRYERWRRADNLPMLAGIDMLKKIFASEKKSLHEFRAFGLNTANRLQWIKNLLMQHAVGNRSDLPKLANDLF